jgi:DNA-binding CsgD family transcriptional regulator
LGLTFANFAQRAIVICNGGRSERALLKVERAKPQIVLGKLPGGADTRNWRGRPGMPGAASGGIAPSPLRIPPRWGWLSASEESKITRLGRFIGNCRFREAVLTRASSIVRRSDKSSAPARRSAARAAEMPQSVVDAALEQPANLIETGIPVIGDMPWGTHICVFYQTKEDLLDTAVSYFAAGLRSNEFCIWVISDPITQTDAMNALRRAVPDLDRRLAAGQIELLDGTEWYLKGDQINLKRITGGWSRKLRRALAKGYDGVRISGNTLGIATKHWKAFCEYEAVVDRSLAGQRMIALCTYSLRASSAVHILDVARVHQCTIARRNGHWEFLETPELKRVKQQIRRLNGAIDIPSKPFSGHKSLTPRERVTLAQIIRGASNKEAARTLGISPRTVEFHRANVMQKLGAKNTADLVRRLLGEPPRSAERSG